MRPLSIVLSSNSTLTLSLLFPVILDPKFLSSLFSLPFSLCASFLFQRGLKTAVYPCTLTSVGVKRFRISGMVEEKSVVGPGSSDARGRVEVEERLPTGLRTLGQWNIVHYKIVRPIGQNNRARVTQVAVVTRQDTT